MRPAAETHPAAGRTIRFRPDIEGLRAVAVVLVVLCDAGVPGLRGGFLGVHVFSVISGFLITAVLLRELDRTGRLSLPRFLSRRARRLLPAAVVVLVTVTVVGYRRPGLLPPVPLLPFRPLAVQVAFYLVWPILLIVLVWLGFRWALPYWVAAVVASSVAYASWFAASGVWLTHLWQIGLGCLLGLAAGRLARLPYRLATVMSVVGLALLVISALNTDPATPLSPYAVVLPVLATLLVLAGRADALLGVRPLQWLGRLSYPLALWHWPVLMIVTAVHDGPPARALAVLGSAGLAALTYLCVENPIRRLNLSCG